MNEIILQNLLSPVVLFFVLGIIAAIVKSDLKFPNGLSEGLSIYLLIAIGIKGGIELSHYSIESVLAPILGALFLGIIIPFITLALMRVIKMDLKNSIGLAATYGSISIVTYGAAITFLDENGISYEGFMNALVVLMESPAILVSLLLLKIAESKRDLTLYSTRNLGFIPSSINLIDKEVLRESIFGKSILLLVGSLLIGWALGDNAVPMVKPLFIDLYSSVLILFLLNMGLIAGKRLPEVKKHGLKLLAFGLFTPLLFGSLGVLVGDLVGLSLGGVTLMGVLAGSASYIAAPAALKTSVPEANPSIYLGLSLGVTFPFNLIIGIPAYYEIAKWIQ
ncbi:sodium-dependent bicarbonate transport family permease [Mesobacillus selenatarsenatis]|uniref:Putative sodium-dependent bicarbonate transporter n=1 Tax=Mesobacillus selenatarsenatis (strain DSM 18680 / JCM 14380 / FERM P-15431 / SF-1) TaxID=1321606 RepID=A0A0A8X9N5_MESS1|nr:sodium-dependent bicarbonate transport family permease [Mesobacillus selenatarsenatis]GAM15742.1 putative sodium-dependent bicarbonate transporter [Mesobacillus selenatarsenatis SF-1]